ncbi:uncharacterized protein [Haliotis cracherodii]|uniref:uncharacterized protein n=1 Tax=Haliotis cracherodii TaxID=6455 RepID=UPI0039ED50F3
MNIRAINCLFCVVGLVPCIATPSKRDLILGAEVALYDVRDLQVPKTKHAFPPFRWDEEQGMWPSDVKMNFHGNPDYALFRQIFGIFDNNMFATTYITTCVAEARRHFDPAWYNQTIGLVMNGINAIKRHHDLNVNYSNSLMTFWPQTYNNDSRVYNSYPVNLNDVIHLTEHLPLNATYAFLESLGLKDVDRIIHELVGMRNASTLEFHLPADFDDTFLNIGLGSMLAEMSLEYPGAYKLWSSHNTNTTSVFDALKYYAYRPFSGDQRVNTIDARSYYYLRPWLEQEKAAGRDVALVPTWVQDTDEVRTWFDKGVMMPSNVNNVDVTVCANFIYAVTSGIIHGVLQPSLLDDPDIMQIYNDTARMIAFQVSTNFSDRADLALTYYPSVIEFYWLVARTYNKLQETLDGTGSLPHKGMDQVLVDFKAVLRSYASPRILAQGTPSSIYNLSTLYFDDFLGAADTDYSNKSASNPEDRRFTTSMALTALLTIWTTQDQHTGKMIWDADTPEDVKKAVNKTVTWVYYHSDGVQPAVPWNVIFAGSFKGFTMDTFEYPMNRLELFNGTKINKTDIRNEKFIQGVEGFIPEDEYKNMMDELHTPTVNPGYNIDGDFFPFWSSEAYTHVIAMLGLGKFIGTL